MLLWSVSYFPFVLYRCIMLAKTMLRLKHLVTANLCHFGENQTRC